MAKWFVRKVTGQEGPYTSTEMRELVAKGQLTPKSVIRREDMEKWVRASSLANLFGRGESTVMATKPPTPPPSKPAPAASPPSEPAPAPAADPLSDLHAELGITPGEGLFRDDGPKAVPAVATDPSPQAPAAPPPSGLGAEPGVAAGAGLFRDNGPKAVPQVAAPRGDSQPARHAEMPVRHDEVRQPVGGSGDDVIDDRLPWSYFKLLAEPSTLKCWGLVTVMAILAYLGWAGSIIGLVESAPLLVGIIVLPFLKMGPTGLVLLMILVFLYGATWSGLATRYIYRHCAARCHGLKEEDTPLMNLFQAGLSFWIVHVVGLIFAFLIMYLTQSALVGALTLYAYFHVLQPMVLLSAAANSGNWEGLSPHRFFPLVRDIGLPFWGAWGIYVIDAFVAGIVLFIIAYLAQGMSEDNLLGWLTVGVIMVGILAQPLTFMGAIMGQVAHDTNVGDQTGVRRVGKPGANLGLAIGAGLALLLLAILPHAMSSGGGLPRANREEAYVMDEVGDGNTFPRREAFDEYFQHADYLATPRARMGEFRGRELRCVEYRPIRDEDLPVPVLLYVDPKRRDRVVAVHCEMTIPNPGHGQAKPRENIMRERLETIFADLRRLCSGAPVPDVYEHRRTDAVEEGDMRGQRAIHVYRQGSFEHWQGGNYKTLCVRWTILDDTFPLELE